MMFRDFKVVIPGLALVGFFTWASRVVCADTVILRPAADTTLFESSPNDNMGAWTHVAAGTTGSAGDRTRNRGLIKFDVAGQIPKSAVIQKAVLTLKVTGIPGSMGGGGSVSSNFELRRVASSWGEGDKLGDRGFPADPGEATWNCRFAPAQRWSTPGAAAPADFSNVVSASQFIAGNGAYIFDSTPALVADVQAWLNSPETNFGWILMSQAESTAKTARKFASREDTNNAPILSIEYTAPAVPRINRVEIQTNQFSLSFTAQAGQNYIVEFRDSVAVGTWSILTNLAAPSAITNAFVFDAISPGRRFYRLRLP
jgi:hypothetical protein